MADGFLGFASPYEQKRELPQRLGIIGSQSESRQKMLSGFVNLALTFQDASQVVVGRRKTGINGQGGGVFADGLLRIASGLPKLAQAVVNLLVARLDFESPRKMGGGLIEATAVQQRRSPVEFRHPTMRVLGKSIPPQGFAVGVNTAASPGQHDQHQHDHRSEEHTSELQ